MKVVFVPNYFYLHMPFFQEIISQLSNKGVTSYVWKLQGNTNISADEEFDTFYFNRQRINFVAVTASEVQNHKKHICSKLRLLKSVTANWKIIRRLLKESKPDLVITGSDLGNLNIRFLMDACYSDDIPILILHNCDLPKTDNKKLFHYIYLLRSKCIFKSSILSLLRAIIFSGTTPGTYTINSTICVGTEEIAQRLALQGIDRKRIVVTGMPFLISSVNCSPGKIYKSLNIPETYRLFVLFTECIQNIYGDKYAKELFVRLASISEGLPDDVFLLIKLHPLESQETETFIRETFNKPRCKVVGKFNVEELIEVSSLCMAHFSRVLITAALMGKRFLSINLMNDRERTFISKQAAEVLEIISFDDFEEKLSQALDDSDYVYKIDRRIAELAEMFNFHDCYEKILQIIMRKQRVNQERI